MHAQGAADDAFCYLRTKVLKVAAREVEDWIESHIFAEPRHSSDQLLVVGPSRLLRTTLPPFSQRVTFCICWVQCSQPHLLFSCNP